MRMNDMSDAITYSSTQATRCAGCGGFKHTPLRNDEMGGYVCLTCIDKELIRLQSRATSDSLRVAKEALTQLDVLYNSGIVRDALKQIAALENGQ